MNIPDPDGYRRAAAVLRQRADQLSHYAARIATQVEGTTFVGPAASRLQDDAVRQRQAVLRTANELHALASSLSRAASVYESQRAAGGL